MRYRPVAMKEEPTSEQGPPPVSEGTNAAARYFDTRPDLISEPYLNNLTVKLAGRLQRQLLTPIQESMPYGELLDSWDREDGGDPQPRRFSELRLKNTSAQFFADIDNAVKELKIDPQTADKSDLLPLYRRLREMGYSHIDLVT